MLEVNDFTTVRISLASPEQIRGWSYGEVTKPETLNYRTLKPEKDGLFCEKIFGPTKDFECYCGKYKKVRYKGIVCDKCGVEVARSKVRRERMGHITLAAPVSHIWFVKGTPSRMGLLLDISPRNLEQVIYFAKFIVTSVDEDKKEQAIQQLRDEFAQEVAERDRLLAEGLDGLKPKKKAERDEEKIQQETNRLQEQYEEEKKRLENEFRAQIEDLGELTPLNLLSAGKYRELKQKWEDLFSAGMGAEAILEILSTIDLESMRQDLYQEAALTSGQRRKKAIKRLRVVDAFRKSGNKPEWMILTVLPVLPPELRPMVQLDGGRFATSDLNDLYRRVINRNNRLRRLLDIGAPEIIIRNEKRMLQEAVDSLIDNGRRGRAVVTGNNHKLKSLSDMLRGKQGRFRQNLLGKRVDYSGRSVIVVGPELKLNQCGLPRRMALELFKPFIMRRLVARGLALNIRSAKRIVERGKPEVWDILEEAVRERPVFLNRAPTLHRLGIQAFNPVLIDGSAIQIHPLVCVAFNADFDGDQMAVHVPLSRAAVEEANKVMLSTHNMMLPSSGEPVVAPTLDIVLGCYYLTMIKSGAKGEGMRFSSFDEAKIAHELGIIELGARIEVRDKANGAERLKTSVGRIIFSEILPEELGFRNQTMDKKALKEIVADCYRLLGNESTANLVDNIKELGFRYVTKSGTTIAIKDIEVPEQKAMILEEAERKIDESEKQFQRGLITEDERYNNAVSVWTQATEELQSTLERTMDKSSSIYMMASSGAKGNISQIRQMAGMRGLMTDPSGRIIDLPIRACFREGLAVLEYFISTHGARKGLADTALRTSDSGYLTRRLIDVSQEVIVNEEDCGTINGIWLSETEEKSMLAPLAERILGRIVASPVAHPETGEIIVDRNEEIDEEKAEQVIQAGIDRIYVRSPLSCQSRRGICQLCYGRSLAKGHLVTLGEAVGIIAAQSIGEPGTQLTMRTFHTGGVAGLDITSGLPRVEELFEARSPKGQAVTSEIEGVVEITRADDGRKIKVISSESYRDEYSVPKGYEVMVENEQEVDAATVLAQPKAAKKEKEAAKGPPLVAHVGGRVELAKNKISLLYEEREEREYLISPMTPILVEDGAKVEAGQQLTEGLVHPQDILRIMGREAVQRYLVDEVQKVYRSQGVNINDKHIEIIVRQMLRKVKVDSPGDSGLLPGELIDSLSYEDINAKVLSEGGEPATAQPVLLGITRASLNTDSFLAKASFQETTRVLTEAAVSGSTDRLTGLKENVIIGKLIPARSEISKAAERLPEPPLLEGELEATGFGDLDTEIEAMAEAALQDETGVTAEDKVAAEDQPEAAVEEVAEAEAEGQPEAAGEEEPRVAVEEPEVEEVVEDTSEAETNTEE
ncbi:MAG TPA: DNA-directed RNA polymerase subunit beta' [Dehalococcoidia bacterium]|nr:DNA-directed RNA polymerase subunit beta' [Dehalococcoidia bacterium]